MLTAVESGDAKELVELMRQDHVYKVNQQYGLGFILLHYACLRGDRSAVIPLLLAHPDIDVNLKNKFGSTPFYCACLYGSTSCVREMLKDSRVNVNEPNHNGWTPLRCAAVFGNLGVIKVWIASGTEMDLGKPGDEKTDAIGIAKKTGETEMVTLLESFKSDAAQTRHAIRVELGFFDELAAEMFALVIFVSDGLLQIKYTTTTTPAARFFNIASHLPLELQMVLCFRQVASTKEIIPGKKSEESFRILVKKL